MRLHPSPFQPLADNCPPSRPSWKPCDASSEKGCQDASQPPGLSPQLPANAKLRLAREYPTESRKMRHKRLWPGPFSTNNRHLRSSSEKLLPLPQIHSATVRNPQKNCHLISTSNAPGQTPRPSPAAHPRSAAELSRKPKPISPNSHRLNQELGSFLHFALPRLPRVSRRAPSHPCLNPF